MLPSNAFDIGSEEAAMLLRLCNELNRTLKQKFTLPTSEPSVLAAGMNLMFSDEDFQELARTQLGKGVMIGAMGVAYYYSHVWRQNEDEPIPQLLDVAGVMQEHKRKLESQN